MYFLQAKAFCFHRMYVCFRDPILHTKTEKLKLLIRKHNFIIKYTISEILKMCKVPSIN